MTDTLRSIYDDLSSARFCGAPLGAGPDQFGTLTETPPDAPPEEITGRYAREGYLFLRGVLPREQVLLAREHILGIHAILGEVDDRFPLAQGVSTGVCDRSRVNVRAVRRAIVGAPSVRAVVRSPHLTSFVTSALSHAAAPWDYMWPRVLAQGSGTGLHVDRPFLRGAPAEAILSAWTPLGDMGPAEGALFVQAESDRCAVYRREYGDLDADSDEHFGWYLDRLGDARARWDRPWLTAAFRMGDVLLFNLDLLHGAFDNTSELLRVTVDSRWQREDVPIDARWRGAFPPGRHPQRIFLPSPVGDNTLNEGLRTEFTWIDAQGRPKQEG